MKKLLFASLFIGSSWAAMAQDAPLWLRHQRISPDGTKIAFCYQGDIYTVPTSGGTATRITSHSAYDGDPIWSPDSRQIAFSSDREGSTDVYIVSAEGGMPRRLTMNSAGEAPIAFADAQTVLFSANILPSRKFDRAPIARSAEIYSVNVKGGRPRQVSSYNMEEISIQNGKWLYTDNKGYEDPWRKHHVSSIARDIWLKDKNEKHTRLTTFRGEDRNAVWDGKGGFYYLSEADGTFNVYHRTSTDPKATATQITQFKKNPVRFLSMADNGLLCFGYDGEIYTLRAGEQPRKLSVRIVKDNEQADILYRQYTSGATSFAVSPNNKEVAFVVHGDVYVASVEHGTTKRITNTPQQERNVDFSKDGRKLVYSGERDGHWQVYMTELTRKEDPLFCYAKELKETQLTKGTAASFQPRFSPDGKEVAFLRDRTAIMVLNLASGKERKVLDASANYSYIDGDQYFSWSPDGKWILTNYQANGGWNHVDCAIVKADGSGEIHNLTQSGYSEGAINWVLDGKAILYESDRGGYRSHGSWGATYDLYLMFLDRKAYDDFLKDKDERTEEKEYKELADKAKSDKKETAKDDKKKKTDKKTDKKTEAKTDSTATKELKFELVDRKERIVRITRASGFIASAVMNKDATKLYYIARYGTNTDLWEYDVLERSSKVISANIGSGGLILGKDGKTLFIGTGSGLKKYENGKITNIGFKAEFEQRPAQEREYVFQHAWQQVKDKFYDKKLHGVDWEGYHAIYKKFLPHINNNRDLAEMLSEMLGELNASHTGARYFRPYGAAQPTASLGAFYDADFPGDGIRIAEIMPNSPLLKVGEKVKEGTIITAINGKKIEADQPLELYLNGLVGKRVTLTLQSGEEVVVTPVSKNIEVGLLYRRWILQREALVKKWSNDRIAYVHVPSMNSPTFRTVFEDLLGKYRNHEAVIVDTRYNGGGWLHEDLAYLLSGKLFARFTPRGQYIGNDPFMQWTKPSCVLMNEGNYSNGHGFPWMYKELGLGKLIGTPVPGTMTAVWWEMQFNNSLVFGIPQTTVEDLQGRVLENLELQPDIEVYNSPEDYLSGEDRQLRRSVEEMLRTIGKK